MNQADKELFTAHLDSIAQSMNFLINQFNDTKDKEFKTIIGIGLFDVYKQMDDLFEDKFEILEELYNQMKQAVKKKDCFCGKCN